MSTQLQRLIGNFVWRLESLSPTAAGLPFRVYDPIKFGGDLGNETGNTRRFVVTWLEAEEDQDVTEGYSRTAYHYLELLVLYPTAIGSHDAIQRMMLSDRHDIIKQLRNPALWVGYDADNPTTDLGLLNRWRVSDRLSFEGDDDQLWELRMRWRCQVTEVET